MVNLLSVIALCICSAAVQTVGGYMETSWPPHGAPDAKKSSGNLRTQKSVPTLSYDYQPRNNRHRHPWRERQGSYYVAPPKVEVANFHPHSSVVDALSSNERRSKIAASGVYRTYGRGQAVIPYPGATVHVPNTFGSQRAYRAMVSTRVFDPPKKIDFDTNDVISRSRRDCAGCPKDEIVVASKGHAYVILPEPCSHRWQTISGPKPGTKLSEGVHQIMGTTGNRRKVCQYQYQVKVRHCPPLKGEKVEVSCTADNAWGSKCSFSCPSNNKLVGEASNECGDDLEWTSSEPKCLETRDCLIPAIENGTQLNCETNELSPTDSNYLPEGAYCRLKSYEVETAMKCKRGKWKKLSHIKGKHRKNRKNRSNKKEKTNSAGAGVNLCEPNPCLQGGSCFTSKTGHHPTYICLCRPQTEGPRCEYSECQENPCQNDARCLQVNGEPSCFCLHNYTGTFCEDTQ